MKKLSKQQILLFFFLWLPAFTFSQQTKNIDSLKQVIKNIPDGNALEKADKLILLGEKYMNSSNSIAAMECYQQSLSIAQQINNDTLIADCYYHLSVIEFYQKDYSKDSIYTLKALEIYRKTGNKLKEGLVLKGLADDYLQKGDSLKAQKYYNQALPIFLALKNKRLEAAVYLNQAILFQSNYRKKIELGLAAKKIWDEYPDDNVLPVINIGNVGVAYLDMVRYNVLKAIKPDTLIPANAAENLKKAESYLRLAVQMAQQKNDPENKSYFTGVLAELQAYKGDYKNAYGNIRVYYDTQDSLYSQDNKNKIASLENQRAIDLKNKEIENKELQLVNQWKRMWLLISVIAFLATIGTLIYRQNLLQKKTNITLLKLNTELADANKIKAKFFGILSHDLRRPVANLITFLNLQKIKPDAMTKQQVQDRENKISSSVQTLLETMESMLLWSKSQMQHFKPENKEVNAGDLFSYISKNFAGEEGITFSFINKDDVYIYTDENYLKTIMYNLTSNAVKALRHTAHPTIEWKAWQENNYIFLSVIDNGPGIDAEKIKALYDETSGSGTKNGLGFHIIRDLAKAIKCHIELRTNSPNGTIAVLSLQAAV
ncbi:MAG: tetratricopeptide repeat-containing sensor histidine kinase [Ginsengibacter sp.]